MDYCILISENPIYDRAPVIRIHTDGNYVRTNARFVKILLADKWICYDKLESAFKIISNTGVNPIISAYAEMNSICLDLDNPPRFLSVTRRTESDGRYQISVSSETFSKLEIL